MDESLEALQHRAKLVDDRDEYKNQKKYGKNYKEFMKQQHDDRDSYKRRMKTGKKGSNTNTP